MLPTEVWVYILRWALLQAAGLLLLSFRYGRVVTQTKFPKAPRSSQTPSCVQALQGLAQRLHALGALPRPFLLLLRNSPGMTGYGYVFSSLRRKRGAEHDPVTQRELCRRKWCGLPPTALQGRSYRYQVTGQSYQLR